MTANTDIMEGMRIAFRAEALDLLPELDAALLAMELAPNDVALVNRVFRAMHTVKGSGATAGFAHLSHFAHRVEEAFDLARAGKLAVTSELIDCGLKACDVIREILEMDDEEGEAPGERAVTEAVGLLLPRSQAQPKAAAPAAVVAPAPAKGAPVQTAYRLIFRPNIDLFCTGTDPLSLLDELRDLGVARIVAEEGEVPALKDFDPTCCYLSWEILLVTDRGEEAIPDVFVFVEDDCKIEVKALTGQPAAAALSMTSAGEAVRRMEVAPGSIRQEVPSYLEALRGAGKTADHELAEPLALQTRILERVLRVARGLGTQDAIRLKGAIETSWNVLFRVTSTGPRGGENKEALCA